MLNRDIISQANIVNEFILDADVNLKLVSTLAGSEYKGPRNPDRGLIRYQLMEVFARIAEEKYVKNQNYPNYADAVQKMHEESLQSCYQMHNQQEWRNERYWNEECDDILKFYKFYIEKIYAKFSVKKPKPGQAKFMCLDELHDICKISDLIEENLVERDINQAFNLGMMTQIDELNSDRPFQMSFVEFLEALGRIAEKLSPQPIGSQNKDPYDIRKKNKLHIKLESLLVKIIDACVDYNPRDPFQIPVKSFFDKKIVIESESSGEEL